MKKILSFLILIIVSTNSCFSCFAKESVQSPIIVNTVYPTEDCVIADIVVTDASYNTDSSGNKDMPAIIQKAIDDCAANGGGTLFCLS